MNDVLKLTVITNSIGIAVAAIDVAALRKDSSSGQGSELLEYTLPSYFGNPEQYLGVSL
jgi:hypothetical protein